MQDLNRQLSCKGEEDMQEKFFKSDNYDTENDIKIADGDIWALWLESIK